MVSQNVGKRFAPPAYSSTSVQDAYAYAPSRHYEQARRRGGKGKIVLFSILGVVLALAVLVGVYAAMMIPSVKSVKATAEGIVPKAQAAVTVATSGDASSLPETVQSIRADVASVRQEMNGGLWTIASFVPVYGADVTNARALVDAGMTAIDDVVTPLADCLAANPIDSILSDGSINGAALQDLCNTVVGVTPAVQSVANAFSQLGDFHFSQLNDLVNMAKDPLIQAAAFLTGHGDALKALPGILGCDGARTYLVVAQNNAEVRATGGLPGAMELVTIENGEISYGDVEPLSAITDIAYNPLPLTDEELAIFGDSLGSTPANMTYTPDFPRAAQLLAACWEQIQGVTVDGVIAVDPVFFQSMLGLVGGVTLSDGSVIDGSNAAQELLSNTYWMYGDDIEMTDVRFAEVAGDGMEAIKNSLGDIDKKQLLKVVKDGVKDGRLLAWFAGDNDEAVVKDLGCSGALNSDASKPELGVFFNDATWSKISWYLHSKTTVNSSQKNADGTVSYSVTTTMSNALTEELADEAPSYVTGYSDNKLSPSDMLTSIYLYAPAGGSISNLTVDGDGTFEESDSTHDGLQVVFGLTHLQAGQQLTFTYTVTTAAKADTLKVRTTPLGDVNQ